MKAFFKWLLSWFRGPQVIFVFIVVFVVWGYYYVEQDSIYAYPVSTGSSDFAGFVCVFAPS